MSLKDLTSKEIADYLDVVVDQHPEAGAEVIGVLSGLADSFENFAFNVSHTACTRAVHSFPHTHTHTLCYSLFLRSAILFPYSVCLLCSRPGTMMTTCSWVRGSWVHQSFLCSQNGLLGCAWMTPRQRERIKAFGQTLFIDGTFLDNKG